MKLYLKHGTSKFTLDKMGFFWNEHTVSYEKILTENEYMVINGYDNSIRFHARMATVHDYGLGILYDLIELDLIRKEEDL